MRRFRIGAALGALIALAGCPRLPPPPPRPVVSLLGIRGAPGQHYLADFQVHNRGSAALVLSAVDWEIAVGDRAILRGRAHARRRFAPDERAPVRIELSIPAELERELRGAAGLRLRGMVHLEDPAGGSGAPAPFDEEARLP